MSHLPRKREKAIAKMMRAGAKSRKTPKHLKKYMRQWLRREGFSQ
jgi:hypothetical protein